LLQSGEREEGWGLPALEAWVPQRAVQALPCCTFGLRWESLELWGITEWGL